MRANGDPGFDLSELRNLVERQIPAIIRGLPGFEQFQVKGSSGMGSQGDVPWVGVFDRGMTSSAQEGIWLAYLFHAAGENIYLSLNQGTEQFRSGVGPLRKRALDIRSLVGSFPNNVSSSVHPEIDLGSSNTRPRQYEAGNAYALRYDAISRPSPVELEEDLQVFAGVLQTCEPLQKAFHPIFEPLHLILKWNRDRERATVQRHVDVADSYGKAWWGSFGSSETPAVGKQNLSTLHDQIEEGIPTYAFLYTRGEVWRTKVSAVEIDATNIDVGRLPGYYEAGQCNAFFLLEEFQELPSEWAASHLVLARNPDPSALPGALGNQTTRNVHRHQ